MATGWGGRAIGAGVLVLLLLVLLLSSLSSATGEDGCIEALHVILLQVKGYEAHKWFMLPYLIFLSTTN